VKRKPAGHSTDPVAAGEQQARSSRRFAGRAVLVFGIALLAAVLFVTVLLLVASSSTWLLDLDRGSSTDLHRYAVAHRGFTSAMRTLSTIGSSIAWWLIMLVLVGWLLWRRLRRLAAFVAVTELGSTLLNNLIKLAVNRSRPHLSDPVAVAAGKSFPSGHAQSAIVGYGVLIAVFLPVLGRRWRPVALVLAGLMVALIGFSRIALGVHYLSDVIGAYLIGTVWLLGMASAFRTWRREEGKPTSGELLGESAESSAPEDSQ
jgi:membrane-associated phospholipid phosphatase